MCHVGSFSPLLSHGNTTGGFGVIRHMISTIVLSNPFSVVLTLLVYNIASCLCQSKERENGAPKYHTHAIDAEISPQHV